MLSPSTEEFDRGQKRLLYQTIDTLAEYVLVAQSEPRLEHWARRGDAQWLVSTLEGLVAQLQLASIGCSLNLADVYERVFPAP